MDQQERRSVDSRTPRPLKGPVWNLAESGRRYFAIAERLSLDILFSDNMSSRSAVVWITENPPFANFPT
jgi:hypothetical protein